VTAATAVVPTPRHPHLDAPENVKKEMHFLRLAFKEPDCYKLVSPARWEDLGSGHHYETSYTNGEGRLRFYPNGQRQHTEQVIIRGLHPDQDRAGLTDLLTR
jgi:hypothetical protein